MHVINLDHDPEHDSLLLVETPALSALWTQPCSWPFPTSYYLRRSHSLCWSVLRERILNLGHDSILYLLGSPGIGRSCFLVLIAMYLACVKRIPVLVIRPMKFWPDRHVVIFLDGKGSFVTRSRIPTSDLARCLKFYLEMFNRHYLDPAVLVDGYTKQELDTLPLPSYFLCSTPCQIPLAAEPESFLGFVFPPWTLADLAHYAKLSRWRPTEGEKHTRQSSERDLVKAHYYYSGGSIRGFCRSRAQLTHARDKAQLTRARDKAVKRVLAAEGDDEQVWRRAIASLYDKTSWHVDPMPGRYDFVDAVVTCKAIDRESRVGQRKLSLRSFS